MEENKKLENDKFEKALEENKRLMESIDNHIKKLEENKVAIDKSVGWLKEFIKERQEEPEESTNLYDFDDLSDKQEELFKLTADRFNRLLKSKGVNTELYSLYKYDYMNMDIFGDSFLNCTIEGILNSDYMPDMMIYLLKIAERVCKSVDYKDFKLTEIRMSKESNDDNDIIFNLTFSSDRICRDIISVTFRNSLEGDFDPDEDIFLNNYAKLEIYDMKGIPNILPIGMLFGEIGLSSSTFSGDGGLYYNDDKTYSKIALIMKTNRENLADRLNSAIKNLSI